MKKLTFHIKGMHCNACIVLTESELKDIPYISEAKASLAEHTIQVVGDFENKTVIAIMDELGNVLKPHGYTLSLEKQKTEIIWSDFTYALLFAGLFIGGYILVQKLGIVNVITSSTVSYTTAFLIGAIASVSTCMAVVGGLVLSLSANYAKGGERIRPQLFFHVGRLISFFLLGGLIGALGARFQLGITATFILNIIVAFTLLILGLNLLDIFSWSKKLQPTMPLFFGKRIHGLKSVQHTFMPIVIGAATFFLPCGFTQSMQVYALSVGSFWTGAWIMLTFALGTLPVLLLLSFSSLTVHKKAQSSVFTKTAGIVVIFFGILNLLNALVAVGIIKPILNF